MKRALVVAAVSLACSASSTAFVNPNAVSGTRIGTNSPRSGDASAAITPLPRGPTRKEQQRAPNNQHGRTGRGRHLAATLSESTTPTLLSAVAPPISSFLSWAPNVVIAVVGVLTAASVVNALQAGVRGDLGLTQQKILGVPAEEATPEHVARLGKAQFMQLFYASPCPLAGDLDGEYHARTLEMGILHPIAAFLTHRLFGPGRWLGKGIRSSSSEGYNLFSSNPKATTWAQPSSPSFAGKDADGGGSGGSSGGGGPSDTRRNRRFRFTPFAQSVFDGGESASLDYSLGEAKNGLLFSGMRDEVRKVNDRLYVGLGYIQVFGGKYNSIPFLLEGPPLYSFSGPDGGGDGNK
ncbi:unnamed protein product [Scytosiphon promiscuus]